MSIELYKGDCLKVMKDIKDKSIDMILCDLYANKNMSMRQIARLFNTNHKLISRHLHKNNIKTRMKKMQINPIKHTKHELNCINMQAHLRFKVDLAWLINFDDFEKIKCLNSLIRTRSSRFVDLNEKFYKKYIEKFYYDNNFNKIYKKWLESNKNHYMKPSLDHIIPVSKGGTNDLDNFQVLTWFENRCKNDMSQKEWDNIKNNINDYFI